MNIIKKQEKYITNELKTKTTCFHVNDYIVMKIRYKEKKKGKNRRFFGDAYRYGNTKIGTLQIKRRLEFYMLDLFYE